MIVMHKQFFHNEIPIYFELEIHFFEQITFYYFFPKFL